MRRRGGPGRRGYPAEFRRRMVDLLAAERKVADVVRDLEISQQVVYTWRRHLVRADRRRSGLRSRWSPGQDLPGGRAAGVGADLQLALPRIW